MYIAPLYENRKDILTGEAIYQVRFNSRL